MQVIRWPFPAMRIAATLECLAHTNPPVAERTYDMVVDGTITLVDENGEPVPIEKVHGYLEPVADLIVVQQEVQA